MTAAGGICRVEEVKAPAVLSFTVADWWEAQRKGGGEGAAGPWITAGHHSRMTFHLQKSRISFFLKKKKRWKKTSCTTVRVEMRVALRFSPTETVQLNTNKVERWASPVYCCSQYRDKPAGGAFTRKWECDASHLRAELAAAAYKWTCVMGRRERNGANAHFSAAFCLSALNCSGGQPSKSMRHLHDALSRPRSPEYVLTLKTGNVYFFPPPSGT